MRLFKYLSPERTDVLENQSIRFTQAKHLNDPFEWLPFSNASGSDTQTKNAVLLEATHTIFSNQQTGYLTADKDLDSSNKIIEIIKGASNVKKD